MAKLYNIDSVPVTPFQSILNFRDVGKTINCLQGLAVLQEGRLFRSARPDEASPDDMRTLVDEYHLRSVIDLRSKTEHMNQMKKHGATLSDSQVVSQANDNTGNSPKIPHVRYYEINLNGKSFERTLLWRLSWLSLGKLINLMVLGQRTEAISILGREVMQPRGLIGLGKDSVDHAKNEIREILKIMAESKNYPLLIHCTQGKDRTGLSVVLLLLLLEMPLGAVSADYLSSERELLPEKESRIREISEMGLSEDFAGCPPDFVSEIHDHISRAYGSVQGYFDRIGVDQAKQQAIIENILQTGTLVRLV